MNEIEKITKPKLVFFQYSHDESLPKFVLLHRQEHIKCLSEFFEVIVISEDCDYQQICDNYQPEIALFESGVNYVSCHRLNIQNTSACPEIPKIGLHNGDSWCGCRPIFLSDMEHWGIETFFAISTTEAEYTPEIADKLFIWPNFIDSDIYRDYEQPKIIPVAFTGYNKLLYPWRQRTQKIISQYYPSLMCPHLGYKDKRTTSRMIYGKNYARMLNASWFVPTCGAVANEVVRKHFEIPGSKSCLITERTPALKECGFIDMRNCVFADESDVLDKLDFLFQNPDELEKITNAGYQLVHTRHTLKQRDQIFQWFNLNKNLKANQKIVQTSPFESLTIVENSSGIKNLHINGNGLLITLLRQGDEKLWAGKYEEAEALYISCLNYAVYMPEPKLRLVLCNLYKGNAAAAISWIVQPIKHTVEDYKALDPEPVEWAYFIISLLCEGKLDDAIKSANQFPSLSHIELDRTRWVINILTNRGDKVTLLHSEQSKCRYSVHQLPNQSFNDWVDNLCTMLKACKQFNLAEALNNSIASKHQVLNKEKVQKDNSIKKLIKVREDNWLKKITKMLAKTPVSESIVGLSVFCEPDYIKLIRWIKSKSRKLVLEPLNHLEKKYISFLPYHFSTIRNDEFFHAIEKLAREEDIKTALIIGASAGEGSTEAFLTGMSDKPRKPTVFCMNISTPQFIKLQKHYANNNYVSCYNNSSFSIENFPDDLKNGIKKIKRENNINSFDVVSINNPELNISTKLDEIYGARFVLLDGINSFHSHKNYNQLLADPNYNLVIQNPSLRDGYAIFEKVNTRHYPKKCY